MDHLEIQKTLENSELFRELENAENPQKSFA
jgi:hypothetical protein